MIIGDHVFANQSMYDMPKRRLRIITKRLEPGLFVAPTIEEFEAAIAENREPIGVSWPAGGLTVASPRDIKNYVPVKPYPKTTDPELDSDAGEP